MAGGGKRGGGDRVLESRHLVGLFLGVVLLCGVFFTLGYVMGRTQYGGSVHAAASLERSESLTSAHAKPEEAENPPAPAAGDWDFYGKKDDAHLTPAAADSSSSPDPASTPSAALKPTAAPAVEKTPARLEPPKGVKGAIVLQVAAVRHESDALAMADALQQKKFPSFVVTPAGDNFYRVQVGPYSDERAAEAARSALDRAGFKAIIKR
jgi:DedD protein